MPGKLLLTLFLLWHLAIFGEDKTIDVVVSYPSPNYLKVLSGLKYRVDSEISIHYLKDYMKKSNTDSNELILTIGNQATNYIRKNYNKKTIFALANYSKETLEYKKGNLCGTFSEVPIEKIFQSIKEFFPELKRVSTFYSREKKNYYIESGKNTDIIFGLIFKGIEIKEKEEFIGELEKLKRNTDVFFINNDPIYTKENFELLSEFCKKNNILLITNIESLTELGVGYSIDQDYFDIGIKTGNLLNKIIRGEENCNMGPLVFPDRQLFEINEEYLKSSGFVIPPEMESKARMDNFSNTALDLYFKGKIETSLNLFKYIQKNDPKNEVANYYIDFIINEKYQDKIRKYLKEGDQFFQKKLYIQAGQVYEKIYKLNPSYPGILEKKKECYFLYSEQKRKEAKLKDSSNFPFQSIKLYQEAIQIYPENTNATSELLSLRRKLSSRIPSLHNEGLEKYNKRKYKESISIYENILLIDSTDKKAKEYLRLSKEKKEALEKLLNCKNNKNNPCSL